MLAMSRTYHMFHTSMHLLEKLPGPQCSVLLPLYPQPPFIFPDVNVITLWTPCSSPACSASVSYTCPGRAGLPLPCPMIVYVHIHCEPSSRLYTLPQALCLIHLLISNTECCLVHCFNSVSMYCCCCSVTKSCPPLCDPMDCRPGFPVLHHLPEFAQTHAHWVSDAIQPSGPLLPPSPFAFNLSQRLGLFQWVSFSHQVAKVLELQFQHQSFQWIFRVDFL